MARERRQYSDDFKKQMVELYNSGKLRCEIIRKYELTPSALSSWINKYNATGSFNINDNRSEEEKELIRLREELQQLRMGNDSLKQSVLIMGRK